MKIKTSITSINGGEEIVRGHKLEDLIKEKSFVEAVFLLLKGEPPRENEARMMNALLTAAIDHGAGTTSALTARIVASSKNSLHTAVAAGILAMGELHGSAIEGAAKFFQENREISDLAGLLKDMKVKKIRIPGYGHAALEYDHRADALFAVAKEIDVYGRHCALAEAVREQLNAVFSKTLPLNIDGAMAAILLDMGFPWQIMKGFFIIARAPGLVAQAYEEMIGDAGLRRLDESEIEYIGKQ